ncbi:hypothetical protein QW131_11890 [Roseibium salinum]|nr:hypothetical protein [Roseibium salinum]
MYSRMACLPSFFMDTVGVDRVALRRLDERLVNTAGLAVHVERAVHHLQQPLSGKWLAVVAPGQVDEIRRIATQVDNHRGSPVMWCLAARHTSPAPPRVFADGFGTAARGAVQQLLIRLETLGGCDIAASPLNGLVSNWLRFYSAMTLNHGLNIVNNLIQVSTINDLFHQKGPHPGDAGQ